MTRHRRSRLLSDRWDLKGASKLLLLLPVELSLLLLPLKLLLLL